MSGGREFECTEYYRPAEAAELIGSTPAALRWLVAKARGPVVARLEGPRGWLVTAENLDRWLDTPGWEREADVAEAATWRASRGAEAAD